MMVLGGKAVTYERGTPGGPIGLSTRDPEVTHSTSTGLHGFLRDGPAGGRATHEHVHGNRLVY